MDRVWGGWVGILFYAVIKGPKLIVDMPSLILSSLPPVMAMHPSLQTRINYPFQWGKVRGFILLLHVDQSGGRVSHHLTKLDPEKRSGWRSCLISESCREEKKRFLSTNFTPHGRNFSFVAITFLSLRLWHCLVIYIYIYISSHKSRWH